MTVHTVPTEIERDRWDRPLVIPPGGGRKTAYRRVTKYVEVLENRYNLEQWGKRMVARGLASRPDLQLRVASLLPYPDQDQTRDQLDKVCRDALDAAEAGAKATIGTSLHALTEAMDRGVELGAVPPEYQADLDAYMNTTACLTHVHIEQFTVQDWLQAAGTPDRVSELNGKRYITDVKTGDIRYGALTIAMQLAVYARSLMYDPATHVRGEHGAEVDKGIVIHLPAGEGTCQLFFVDLLAGWDAVKVARQVWEKRSVKAGHLYELMHEPTLSDQLDTLAPLGATAPARPVEDVHLPPTVPPGAPVYRGEWELERLIRACKTADDVRRLWSERSREWTDALTAVAKDHIAGLTG